MRGPHFIRAWSKTQATVSLSSGEAELQGVVRAGAEGIGVRGLARDLGDVVGEQFVVYADASAALGMVARRGVGRIRHLDTRLLWVQESSLRRGLDYQKIDGKFNPADALTKYVPAEGLAHMTKFCGLVWRSSAAIHAA